MKRHQNYKSSRKAVLHIVMILMAWAADVSLPFVVKQKQTDSCPGFSSQMHTQADWKAFGFAPLSVIIPVFLLHILHT